MPAKAMHLLSRPEPCLKCILSARFALKSLKASNQPDHIEIIFHRGAGPQLVQAGVPIVVGNATALKVNPFGFAAASLRLCKAVREKKPEAPPSLQLEMGYLSKKYIELSIEGRPHFCEGNAQGWDFFLRNWDREGLYWGEFQIEAISNMHLTPDGGVARL